MKIIKKRFYKNKNNIEILTKKNSTKSKAYYENNKEIIALSKQIWREKNKENLNEENKSNMEANKEKQLKI